jgi:hypothetical protein
VALYRPDAAADRSRDIGFGQVNEIAQDDDRALSSRQGAESSLQRDSGLAHRLRDQAWRLR